MKRRAWTAAKKARVIEYYKQHGSAKAQKKYRLSGSMLTLWARTDRPPRSAAPHEGMRTNGSAVRDAIVYLQHAQGALKDGEPLSNAELFALLALRTLTGEITK